ncbi:hypothetical protein GCM10020001_085800 [Nonomuraea salmonea]
MLGDRLLVRGEALGLAAQHEPQLDARRAGGGGGGDGGQVGAGDEDPGAAVGDDVGQLVGLQPGADRRVVQAGAVRGPGDGQEERVVGQHEGDVVAGTQAGGAEEVGQPVRLLVQLAVGDDLPGARHDHSGLVGG